MASVPSKEASILDAERAHLARARTGLTRMRERTASLSARGGDFIADQALRQVLEKRMVELEDQPDTPLFFGRIDDVLTDEAHYVGRRHVQDESGDPLVLDWRADIAVRFYRASHTNPMDTSLRRRFGFEGGQISAYEDEHLADSTEADLTSELLATEIERPRVGPMRDIVSTIQPEQDTIVRAPLEVTTVVQGAPGTGKTAAGLHRLAFLLYAHRERLRRSGVLIVGPNAAFLNYIRDVLPALGEIEVKQTSLTDFAGHVPLTAEEPTEVAAIKGDTRMAAVLRRTVYSHVRPPAERLTVPHGARRRGPCSSPGSPARSSRRWRLPAGLSTIGWRPPWPGAHRYVRPSRRSGRPSTSPIWCGSCSRADPASRPRPARSFPPLTRIRE